MRYIVSRINKTRSRYSGSCYFVLLKNLQTQKTYKTWLHPQCGNFKHWQSVIRYGKGTELTGLKILNEKQRLVDADCIPKILSTPPKVS